MYLSENTPEAQAMRQNVVDLVKSQEPTNFTLALQLMKGGGFVPQTITPIWRYVLENPETKKEVNAVFKQFLPERAYALWKLSFEYEENLSIFAVRCFDELAEFEGFGWENLTKDILSYTFQDTSQTTTFAKKHFLYHPKINQLRLLQAMTTSETDLDLSSFGLTHLPEDIGDLEALTFLNMSYNKISQLPESFYKLTNLNNLYLTDNPIEKDSTFLPTLKAKSPKIWVAYMCQNIGTQDIEQIESIYREILSIFPDHTEAFNSLLNQFNNYKKNKKIIALSEAYPDMSASDSYYGKMIADTFFEEQQYEKALERYEKIVQENPYSEPYTDCSKAYLKLGRFAEAIQSAEKAIRYDDQYLDNYLALIEAHIAHKDFTEALKTIENCRNAITGYDNEFVLLFKTVQIHIALGQVTEAETLYQKILKKRADVEDDWIVKAELCEILNKENEATKWYKKIIQEGYAHNQKARFRLGYLYLKKQLYPKAECIWIENLQYIDSGLITETYLALMCLEVLQGETLRALAYLQKALQDSDAIKSLVKHEPRLDSIRQDARFLKLIRNE
jgi:tetratricopeptide (TPR) repeat protein